MTIFKDYRGFHVAVEPEEVIVVQAVRLVGGHDISRYGWTLILRSGAQIDIDDSSKIHDILKALGKS